MAIEVEVKFRMDQATWQKIRDEFARTHPVHAVERQTNKYFNTKNNMIEKKRIGLRLRVLPDRERSILAIKRDTKEAHKRQEVEERYEGIWEQLPPQSPVLLELLQEVESTYEDIIPLVTLQAERTVFMLEEPGFQAEVCLDDVTIFGPKQESKLYEVEFELLAGPEERLLQIADAFRQAHGDSVQQSGISKLEYALGVVARETL